MNKRKKNGATNYLFCFCLDFLYTQYCPYIVLISCKNLKKKTIYSVIGKEYVCQVPKFLKLPFQFKGLIR